MNIFLWILLAFLCGSIPFAPILGRLMLDKDIRAYGDGNPGGTNLVRAGSLPLGVLSMILDGLKAAIPIGIAHFVFGLPFWGMVAVALAPLLGHAFSPFLKGHGGKAVATTFGVWTGLTLGEVPILLGLQAVFWGLLLDNGGWAAVLPLLGVGIYLLIFHRDPLLLLVWLGNLLLLVERQRRDLRVKIHLNPKILRWAGLIRQA